MLRLRNDNTLNLVPYKQWEIICTSLIPSSPYRRLPSDNTRYKQLNNTELTDYEMQRRYLCSLRTRKTTEYSLKCQENGNVLMVILRHHVLEDTCSLASTPDFSFPSRGRNQTKHVGLTLIRCWTKTSYRNDHNLTTCRDVRLQARKLTHRNLRKQTAGVIFLPSFVAVVFQSMWYIFIYSKGKHSRVINMERNKKSLPITAPAKV